MNADTTLAEPLSTRPSARASLPLFPTEKLAFIAGLLSSTNYVSRLTRMKSSAYHFFSTLPGTPSGTALASRPYLIHDRKNRKL